MAYLAFTELGGAAVRKGMATQPRSAMIPASAEPLTALEWAVVALARKDRLRSLRTAGRLASALRLLSKSPNPVLADPRLEALRRIAVLTWHHGYSVPGREVAAVLDAGFTPGQYETMADRINHAKRPRVVAMQAGAAALAT